MSRQEHSSTGELLQVGSFEEICVAIQSGVGPAKIIHIDDDEIGSFGCPSGQRDTGRNGREYEWNKGSHR